MNRWAEKLTSDRDTLGLPNRLLSPGPEPSFLAPLPGLPGENLWSRECGQQEDEAWAG
jgi:hypothetical protein